MKKHLVLGIVLGGLVFGLGLAGSVRAIGTITNDDTSTSITITPTDLGVSNVGTLPTSFFYFLKQWGRGFSRLFTFDPVAKAQLELTITNQVAAELIEVDKANPDNAPAIQNALHNLTTVQENLNARISGLSTDPSDPSVAKLLQEVDKKTALHVALLGQLTKEHLDQPEYATLLLPYFEVDLNTQRTFTVTNTGGAASGALSAKQKAADQIVSAGAAIQKAESAFGQTVTFTATVVNSGSIPTGTVTFLDCGVVTPVNDAPVPGIHLTVRKASGEAMRTSTDEHGCFGFPGLTPGTYTVSVAGEPGTRLIVGTDGGVWRGAVTYTGLTDVREGTLRAHHYVGTVTLVKLAVANPANTGDTSSSHAITAQYSGDANFIIIANAKNHLLGAKEAFASEDYGQAFGLARSAQALARSIFVAVGDINGDGRPDQAEPSVSPTPSPKSETPHPSPKETASPTVRPTPEKTETPHPTETEHATPTPTPTPTHTPEPTHTPTPTENSMGTVSPTPTPTEQSAL